MDKNESMRKAFFHIGWAFGAFLAVFAHHLFGSIGRSAVLVAALYSIWVAVRAWQKAEAQS